MPPEIAAFFCSTFILIALYLDIKRKPNVSFAIWLPLFWLLVRGSRPLGAWVNAFTGYGGIEGASQLDSLMEGSSIDRNFLSILIIFGTFILLKRKVQWNLFFKENRWVIVLYLVCFISLLWSDFPYIGFKRWTRGFGVLLMSIIVLTEQDRVEALKTIIKRCAYILIPLSILLIKYYRHLGILHDEYGVVLAGATTGKNPLGLLCAICGLFFVWFIITERSDRYKEKPFYQSQRIINLAIMVMIFWLFYKANSATSLGCFIIGSIIILVLGFPSFKKNYHNFSHYIVVITVLILPIILLGFESFLSSSLEVTGHAVTFWSRVKLWKVVLEIGTNPFWGVGYESFWLGERLEKIWGMYWWNPGQAHNGYLQVYLDLGILGLSIWAGVLFSSYRNIMRTLHFDYEFGRFQIALMAMFLVFNVTEAYLSLKSLLWFIFLLTILYYPQRPSSIKSKEYNT